MCVNGLGADRIGAPDQLEQLVAGVGASWVAEQRAQQVELATRELDVTPGDRAATPFESEETVLRTGTLDLAPGDRAATRFEVELTRREFDLLGALLSYPGRVHPREQLLELVWGTDSISPKTVDGHIAALRRKLGSAISIVTLRGLGYRLDPAAPPAPLLRST